MIKKIKIDLSKIKEELFNIPEEVINLWIIPIAEINGWPPLDYDQWDKKVTGESFSFWNDAAWEKKILNLEKIDYSSIYYDTMKGLNDAYINDKLNSYSSLTNGKERFFNCLKYILENGNFPKPPIICLDEIDKYQILDGNHRFFAFLKSLKIYEEYKMLSSKEQDVFLKKLGIGKIVPININQEVWICRPKWENSKDAQTRQYLRKNGYFC